MSAWADLSFSLGETWTLEITCKDEAGAAINLTGATARWRVAVGLVRVLDLTLASGVSFSATPIDGKVTITVPPADQETALFMPGIYQHELQIVPANGTVSDQVEGNLLVTDSLFERFA